MRIIAGEAKGRRLRSPRHGTTRPFTARAREAVFSILGPKVTDARVLDLYAGTGSLGLEALSRGATEVTFVEADSATVRALRGNVAAVGLGGRVIEGSVEQHLKAAAAGFDLVFVDPPYATNPDHLAGILEGVGELLAPGGMIVVHRRRGTSLRLADGTMLSIRDRRRYGDADVWWLDKEER